MNRVKELREKNNISQNNLAIKVGVTPKYIGFIENNERNPSLNVAKKIAEVFNEKIDDIFLL
ncbi:helix-turn-helix transcriptional regulator [Peptoniphilus indolicus]|uniref:XRE family transcriptional regulator n=2 Tax=Peptoniphilus indolicus TaxID=33030 RepID=G4D5L0_9FIRM|nr:helix-turn-helix transcriptional regulator [Peptoniphilus indolicus]EGY78676.1 XRE family transcriptional regulator [Peptoniphilus indolicus ATCC 29427]SUB74430.1 Predicted transcriptional regulator [Peptoniphilus indolicus]